MVRFSCIILTCSPIGHSCILSTPSLSSRVLPHFVKVPMDVPDVALEMMQELIYGEPDRRFHTYPQDIDRSEKSSSDSCPLCPPSSSSSCTDDDNNNGKHSGSGSGSNSSDHDNKQSKTPEIDDLSSNVMSRERVWIGILLTIIAFMTCWIMNGRSASRKNQYKGFGSDMVELTSNNGGYSDFD